MIEKHGLVIRKKLPKTVTVLTSEKKLNLKYKKYYTKKHKYLVHDELNICKEGNHVLFKESRPYSKLKKWVITKLILN